MASQGPPPPPREGLDLATLFISAIASAAAAYVTSKIWAPGTLFSAALSPVIVALVKEALRKPTEVITNVVPQVVPTPSKWTRASAGDPGLVAEVHERPAPETPEQQGHDAPAAPIVVPTGQSSPVRVYSTRGRRLRWRLAVVTGLLGFAIAVLAFTVPELIAGQSLGGAHKTTIFGGHHRHRTSTTKTTTSTTSTQKTTTTATTPTQTQTVTKTETVTTPTTPTQTTPAPSTAAPSSTAPPSAAPQGGATTP